MEPEILQGILDAGLTHEHLHVTGDGRHFEAVVVCAAFRGLSKIQQHRMVYDVLGERMREEVHALSLKTFTPEAWAEQHGNA